MTLRGRTPLCRRTDRGTDAEAERGTESGTDPRETVGQTLRQLEKEPGTDPTQTLRLTDSETDLLTDHDRP